jgi:hypothetical protein
VNLPIKLESWVETLNSAAQYLSLLLVKALSTDFATITVTIYRLLTETSGHGAWNFRLYYFQSKNAWPVDWSLDAISRESLQLSERRIIFAKLWGREPIKWEKYYLQKELGLDTQLSGRRVDLQTSFRQLRGTLTELEVNAIDGRRVDLQTSFNNCFGVTIMSR